MAEPSADNRQIADRYRAGPPAFARAASEGCRAVARRAKAGHLSASFGSASEAGLTFSLATARLATITRQPQENTDMTTLHKRGRLAAAPIRRLDPERIKPGSAGHGAFNPAARGSSPPGFISLCSRSEGRLPRRSPKGEGGLFVRALRLAGPSNNLGTTSINGRARDS